MFSEKDPHSFLHKDSLSPALPIRNTVRLIDRMPEDKWVIPETKIYIEAEEIDNPNSELRDVFQNCWNNYCYGLFTNWVEYLDSAERGLEMMNIAEATGYVSGNREDIKNYQFIITSMNNYTNSENNRLSKRMAFQKIINDCRNTFLYLIPEDKVNLPNHIKPEIITKEEIKTTKFLIKQFSVFTII